MKRSQKGIAVLVACLAVQLEIGTFTRAVYAQPARSESITDRRSFQAAWVGDAANAVVAYGAGVAVAAYGLVTGAGNYLSGLIGHHEHRVQPALPTALD